jgi:hypothetical protein
LASEVIKVIRGESKLNPDLLNKLYEEAKQKAADSERHVREFEGSLQSGEQMRASLSEQFSNIQSWSDMYDTCEATTASGVPSEDALVVDIVICRGLCILLLDELHRVGFGHEVCYIKSVRAYADPRVFLNQLLDDIVCFGVIELAKRHIPRTLPVLKPLVLKETQYLRVGVASAALAKQLPEPLGIKVEVDGFPSSRRCQT